jgi:hypothetical protein
MDSGRETDPVVSLVSECCLQDTEGPFAPGIPISVLWSSPRSWCHLATWTRFWSGAIETRMARRRSTRGGRSLGGPCQRANQG